MFGPTLLAQNVHHVQFHVIFFEDSDAFWVVPTVAFLAFDHEFAVPFLFADAVDFVVEFFFVFDESYDRGYWQGEVRVGLEPEFLRLEMMLL